MEKLHIVPCGREGLSAAAVLACRLWPEHDTSELEQEFSELLESGRAAVFLAGDGDSWIGFAQCQLRSDYVEGTQTSPVGYLEGIYVEPEYRRRGIAARLLDACEAWAAEQGCTEFASDAEISNRVSRSFHKSMGFTEAAEIVHFAKKLSGFQSGSGDKDVIS